MLKIGHVQNTNERGELIETLMVDYNLDCSNIGIQPTYTGGMGSSLIDATLISNDKSNLIKNWRLDPEYSFSDHRMITFQIGIKKQK